MEQSRHLAWVSAAIISTVSCYLILTALVIKFINLHKLSLLFSLRQ